MQGFAYTKGSALQDKQWLCLSFGPSGDNYYFYVIN
jgi:hypothetical protein